MHRAEANMQTRQGPAPKSMELRTAGIVELSRLHAVTHLERHDELLLVGYSFPDEHINHYMPEWFDGRPRWHMIALCGRCFIEHGQRTPLAFDIIECG